MAKTFKFKITKVILKYLDDFNTVRECSPHYVLHRREKLRWIEMEDTERFRSPEGAVSFATAWVQEQIEEMEREKALKVHAKELETVKTVIRVGEIRTDTLRWKDLS